ncbi:MAG: AAC(3) family N-acetyltransferase [Methyloceanibacter sp.]
MTQPPRTAESLTDDLRRLGARAGDTLMIHASLRAIGPLHCGPEALLDALEDAVGDDGTLLMIMGAEIEQDWVNRLPEPERLPLLAEAPAFDPVTAPVFHEVGYFAEIFRRRRGTLVTDNPSGRFGARGRLAQDLLAEAPWHDYYGPGSPLDRLCRRGGRILRMGANLDTTTVLHFAEYRAELPDKRRVRRHYRCRGAQGPETRVVDCLDDEHGIADWPGEDYFAVILRDYLATGRAKRGLVGLARSELIEARDLVDFGVEWMNTRFRDFRSALD